MGKSLSFPGSNITLVKTHNLRAVLLSLLYGEHLSRVELARETGLSNTTISNLTAELLEQGIIIEEGNEQQSAFRRVGRPRTALRLVPDARFAVGVHIGIGILRIAVTNLFGEIRVNRISSYNLDDSPSTVLDQICAEIEKVISDSGISRQGILGVGVGASGLVEFPSGINLLAPNLGWHNIPIKEILSNRLNLPVVVDNNVRAMALGEALFGAGRGTQSLAFVYGRVGVGAGFVFGGEIYRGINAGAGEIGHAVILAHGGEPCRCGNSGCLETLVSETIIKREAQNLIHDYPDSILATMLSSNGGNIDGVFAAARAGDPYTLEMLHTRACYLGIALANLVNILNPEVILLGGLFAQGADIMLPAIQQTMRNNAFAGLGDKVKLLTSSFGWRAGVIGAATLALTDFFYYQP